MPYKFNYSLSGFPMRGWGERRLQASSSITLSGDPGGSEVPVDNGDQVFIESTTFAAEELTATFTVNSEFGDDAKVTNLTPSLWAEDSTLVFETLNGVVEGTAKIQIESRKGRVCKRVNIGTELAATENSVWSRPKAGSLAAEMYDRVGGALTNTSLNLTDEFLSTNDHGGRNYAFNSLCWTGAIDLTGVSVANSSDTPQQRHAVAVTRRHVTCATHWGPGVGWKLYFVDSDGVVHERTVVSRVSSDIYEVATGTTQAPTDRLVCLLDENLPAKVSPIAIPARNWADKMKAFTNAEAFRIGGLGFSLNKENRMFPMLCDIATEQYKIGADASDYSELFNSVQYQLANGTKAYPIGGALWDVSSGVPNYGISYNIHAPADLPLPAFPICSGAVKLDSGNPSFTTLDGVTPILWNHYYSAGDGPGYVGAKAVIDAMIAKLDADAGISTEYAVAEVGASSYPDYS